MFTWELMWDTEVNEVNQYTWMVDGEPIEMVKIDDYTIKMILPKPYPAVLENLKWFIPVPEHLLKDVPRAELVNCEWGAAPVLTGPFKFTEYKPGEYVKPRLKTTGAASRAWIKPFSVSWPTRTPLPSP